MEIKRKIIYFNKKTILKLVNYNLMVNLIKIDTINILKIKIFNFYKK